MMKNFLMPLFIAIFVAHSPIIVAAAATSPESEMALKDCESQDSAKRYYSCSCIAKNITTYVDEVVTERVQFTEKAIKMLEDGMQRNLANPNFSDEKKELLKKAGQNSIEFKKADIARLQDKSNWDDSIRGPMVSTAYQKIYQDPLCKRPEGIREREYNNCLGAYSLSPVKGKTQEEYCTCSAERAAELWTDPSGRYSPQVSSVQARQQCRK